MIYTEGKVKYIDPKELADLGYLQEVNRLFFHPLGLQLEVGTFADGHIEILGVADFRDDPEGCAFNEVEPSKTESVEGERLKRDPVRFAALGYVTQPSPSGAERACEHGDHDETKFLSALSIEDTPNRLGAALWNLLRSDRPDLPVPAVYPSSGGSLSFIWNQEKVYVDIEIEDAGECYWYAELSPNNLRFRERDDGTFALGEGQEPPCALTYALSRVQEWPEASDDDSEDGGFF